MLQIPGKLVGRPLLDMIYSPEQIDHLLTLETGPVLLSWKLALGHAEIRLLAFEHSIYIRTVRS